MNKSINSLRGSSSKNEPPTPGSGKPECFIAPELVNDMHSQLNPTWLKARFSPQNHEQLVAVINVLRLQGERICVSGGRHAMGGQQFRESGILLDMTGMKQILNFDKSAGLVEVESGCLWSELIPSLKEMQKESPFRWVVAQKQTGCDRLSIGGALSANAHGRGLAMAPMISDIEQFKMVKASGESVTCSRVENEDLFRLVAGGYGLFGVISSITFRLVPAVVLKRTVEVCAADDVVSTLETKASDGAIYGDYQFNIDDKSPDFLKAGILSVYTSISGFIDLERSTEDKILSLHDWCELIYLAHEDKSLAFKKYLDHYLSTDGQLYSSDSFQLATYLDDYHKQVDERRCASIKGSEMITELYVPRQELKYFLQDAAVLLRNDGASLIYGTVRLIEKDNDSFLKWAKENWACIVLNLHVDHSPESIAKVGATFRRLIDLAIKFHGSYYLTYHRFASAEQLMACYPELPAFLNLKTEHDPMGLFQSDWFDHCSSILNELEVRMHDESVPRIEFM
jgi:FAD/FMN-containing dehydrogenase